MGRGAEGGLPGRERAGDSDMMRPMEFADGSKASRVWWKETGGRRLEFEMHGEEVECGEAAVRGRLGGREGVAGEGGGRGRSEAARRLWGDDETLSPLRRAGEDIAEVGGGREG